MNEVAAEAQPTLQLGTARVVITPPIGSEMSGFIARTASMSGVHDDLYARAMVWSDGSAAGGTAGLLTLDVIGLDDVTVKAIRARVTHLTGIPGNHVAVTATHTHGGPDVLTKRRLGTIDEHYLGFLVNASAGAVAAAFSDRQPVVASFAIGYEPTVGKNRRVPGGPIDPDVPVLRFHGRDGRVRALLVSYACHPVTLGPDNLLATADYPGYTVRTLEAVYPDALALFATGCCGQINTGHQAYDSVIGRGFERRTFAEAERIGRVVAAAAVQAAERAAPPAGIPLARVPEPSAQPFVKAACSSVQLPLLPLESAEVLQSKVSTWRGEAERLRAAGGPAGDRLMLLQWADWAEMMAGRTDAVQNVAVEVMAIALGRVIIVMLPGEAFVELGLEIKQRADCREILVLAYANGSPGYIPHRSAYDQGGYEVSEAYRFYGYPAGFAPEAAERLVDEAMCLVRALKGEVSQDPGTWSQF